VNAASQRGGLPFARMHGCGNDFVVIDDRAGRWHTRRELLAQELCDRRKGLGGDGLILIENGTDGADFRMVYINRTGIPNPNHSVSAWTVPGITRYHTGAWPLILDLFEEGLASKAAVTIVRQRLLSLGQSENDRDVTGFGAAHVALQKNALAIIDPLEPPFRFSG
jgi:hypothetical protein